MLPQKGWARRTKDGSYDPLDLGRFIISFETSIETCLGCILFYSKFEAHKNRAAG